MQFSPFNPRNAGWAAVIVGVGVLLTVGIKSNVCPSSGSIWLRYGIYGFRSGVIYAMIALGYTMVYGVLQLLNFAHSEIFMIGTFGALIAATHVLSIPLLESGQYPYKTGLVLIACLAFILMVAMLFVVPVLTMRLFSEEKRTGTLEMLLTAPVNEITVLLSKFLAAWFFYLLTWLPLAKKSQTHRRRTRAPVMAMTAAQTEPSPRSGTRSRPSARRMLNGR